MDAERLVASIPADESIAIGDELRLERCGAQLRVVAGGASRRVTIDPATLVQVVGELANRAIARRNA